jgi:hypothetical protein
MKKLISLALIISLFLFCGPKQRKAEKIMEDGVEVILNHIEPYKTKGEPSTFILDEEFTVDTEAEDLAGLGIKGIDELDVDLEGNIYLSTGEQIFKFDKTGKYTHTIGRRGQGPGEYQSAFGLRITDSGQLSFYDGENAKFLFFNPDGTLKKEIKKTATMFTYVGIYLDNGNFLLRERQDEPKKGIRTFQYALLNKNFEKIKNLQPSFWLEIPYFQPSKISLLGYSMSCGISNDKIFVSSNVKEDLEIEVYNFQGDLLKKVRKENERLKVSNEYKERIVKRWKSSPAWEEWDLKNKHYFPDFYPPFKEFWVDDQARILVETYEQGERPDEVLLQIFNPEGVFIGTKYLKAARARKFKYNRLYSVYRKESGYDELVVYKMKWE